MSSLSFRSRRRNVIIGTSNKNIIRLAQTGATLASVLTVMPSTDPTDALSCGSKVEQFGASGFDVTGTSNNEPKNRFGSVSSLFSRDFFSSRRTMRKQSSLSDTVMSSSIESLRSPKKVCSSEESLNTRSTFQKVSDFFLRRSAKRSTLLGQRRAVTRKSTRSSRAICGDEVDGIAVSRRGRNADMSPDDEGDEFGEGVDIFDEVDNRPRISPGDNRNAGKMMTPDVFGRGSQRAKH